MRRQKHLPMRVSAALLCGCCALLGTATASADVVTLTNGTRFTGVVSENSPTAVTIKSDGAVWTFRRERVVSVELEAAGREHEARRERAPARPPPSRAASAGASRGDFGAKRVRQVEGRVIVYGTSWCGFCARARSFFASRGIPYEDRDVEKDPEAREEIAQKCMAVGRPFTGGVPVLDVYGSIIHGFDLGRIEQALQQHSG